MRQMSVKDLTSQIERKFKELANFSLQRTTGQLKSTSKIKFARREIARLKTVLKEKYNNE